MRFLEPLKIRTIGSKIRSLRDENSKFTPWVRSDSDQPKGEPYFEATRLALEHDHAFADDGARGGRYESRHADSSESVLAERDLHHAKASP